jgi:glycosyltransferase involved in cell wall biosynthesis
VNQPFISFIIPVLNGEKGIARCLTSIRSQCCSAEEYEVLVLDNGSTDRTDQIVRGCGFNLRVVPGVSVAALRNHGAETARGDYLAFVDADVELAPTWLQNGLAGFRDRTVVAIGGPRGIPEGATWVQQTWGLHLESHRPKNQSTPVPWLYSMAFIVRRNEFLAIRGFAENLETAEDVDLCYRLGQGGTILYNPAMKAVHWGEDPDLATFWNKEVWRGKSSFKGILSHGLRCDELPSLGYPIYVLLLLLLLSLSCVLDFWNRQFNLTLISLGLLSLPALILAMDTIRRVRKPIAFPRLFLLYFIYGLARAYSIVRT